MQLPGSDPGWIAGRSRPPPALLRDQRCSLRDSLGGGVLRSGSHSRRHGRLSRGAASEARQMRSEGRATLRHRARTQLGAALAGRTYRCLERTGSSWRCSCSSSLASTARPHDCMRSHVAFGCALLSPSAPWSPLVRGLGSRTQTGANGDRKGAYGELWRASFLARHMGVRNSYFVLRTHSYPTVQVRTVCEGLCDPGPWLVSATARLPIGRT